MSRFDDLVRAGLGSKNGMNGATHPDADLLSAFAERALGHEERLAVAEHLAGCAECRELLRLAARDAVPVPLPRRVRWPAWPAAGVALAACCALVYLLIPRPIPRHHAVAVPHPNPVAAMDPPKEVRTLEPEQSSEETPEKKKVKRVAAAKKTDPVVAQGQPEAAPSNALVVNDSMFQKSESQVISASPMTQSFRPKMLARAATAAVRWSINAGSELERSHDGGRTWERVAVGGGGLRAVAAAGAQVWAGGEESALFHSADTGGHWNRIAVADGDRKLTGTIVRIRVEGDSVDLATSTGERWSSVDGGRSWR